jgi:D-3-phosphoglycerate dehydrogenase
MRILFADQFPTSAVEALVEEGYDCELMPGLTAAEIPAASQGFDVLVVRSTGVTAEVFGSSPSLSLVIRAGAGTNTIDKDAAAGAGVLVANVPGRNAVAVAELTMGLILSLDRRIPDNVVAATAGEWKKGEFSKADGLMGKTIGILGFGSIGQEVGARAQAFGMEVVIVAKPRSEAAMLAVERLGVKEVDSLLDLAAASDVVTLHVPATGDTKHLIDAGFLGAMKEGAKLINTSRASVLDEDEVLEAMRLRGIRVAVDVFEGEPGSNEQAFTSPFAQHPDVLVTHHIGASTQQAQDAVAEGVIDLLHQYRAGALVNAVNMESTPGGAVLTVRHQDKVGVLSDVLYELKRSGVNIREMSNHVFAGAGAAFATIRVSSDISPEVVALLNATPEVIHCSLRESD